MKLLLVPLISISRWIIYERISEVLLYMCLSYLSFRHEEESIDTIVSHENRNYERESITETKKDDLCSSKENECVSNDDHIGVVNEIDE